MGVEFALSVGSYDRRIKRLIAARARPAQHDFESSAVRVSPCALMSKRGRATSIKSTARAAADDVGNCEDLRHSDIMATAARMAGPRLARASCLSAQRFPCWVIVFGDFSIDARYARNRSTGSTGK